jgi:hypothetical protein
MSNAMNRPRRNFGKLSLLVVGVSLIFIASVKAQTRWLGFRNELKIPIVIQDVPAGNPGNPGRPPRLLYPGETNRQPMMTAGRRQIVIYSYNPRGPGILLYQGTLPCKDNEFHAIQFNPAANKVFLVPLPPPAKWTPARSSPPSR